MAFGCHVVEVFVNEYSLNKIRSPELWATSWPHLLLGCNLATMNDIVHPPQRESFNRMINHYNLSCTANVSYSYVQLNI